MTRSIRSRHGPKSPDAVDRHVGQRIRAQRMLLGLSQGQVAESLDVTFQQVQKYERGVNRVGAGRLNQIATALGVPVTFFYEGAPELQPQGRTMSPTDSGMNRMTAFLATREGSQMMSAFLEIRNEEIRGRLLGLINALSVSRAGERPATSE